MELPLPNLPTSSNASMSPAAKRALISLVIFVGVVVVTISGALVYASNYTDKVLPGIFVESIPVGKMTRDEVKNYFDGLDKKLSHEPIHLSVDMNDVTQQVVFSPEQGTHSIVRLDSDKIADYLISFGKQGNVFVRAWQVFNSSLHMRLPTDFVVVYEEELLGSLKRELGQFETKAEDAQLTITSIDPYAFTVTPSVIGLEFNYQTIAKEIEQRWFVLQAPTLTVKPQMTTPQISEAQVTQAAEAGKNILAQGNISFTYHDEHTKRDLTWKATPTQIAKWLQPQSREGDTSIVLGAEQLTVEEYLKQTIEPSIHREPRDAKFSMVDGKVVEFLGSQSGTTLKYEEAYQAINTLLVDRSIGGNTVTSTIALAVTTIEPEITTGEVNDLGIEDVLGVGYSSYKGSPANRIKNIRFAVTKKLNGIIVKPGEIFSMLDSLKPFTIEGGYLPELVIKGDRIKPEIGGGLCQVGSTMFRAAMNSGLSIEERRNHSLVVSYYNDPRNNMPGADATIYDPAPDFKFKNDTDSNILITTEMNEKTQELFFTLWGKSDGRKGHYDPPILHKWIPAGPTQEVMTDELAPGQKKCQEPHPGAVASLAYYIDKPNGETIKRVFESYYRPLPRICLVGGIPVPPTSPDVVTPIVPAPGPADTAIPIE